MYSLENGTPLRIRTGIQRILNPSALPISVEGQRNWYMFRFYTLIAASLICVYRGHGVCRKMPSHYTWADLPVKDLFIVTAGPHSSYSVKSMLAMVPYIKTGGQGWNRTTDVYRGSFPLCRRVHSTALLPGHVISNIVAGFGSYRNHTTSHLTSFLDLC